jgi:hypothetical protein
VRSVALSAVLAWALLIAPAGAQSAERAQRAHDFEQPLSGVSRVAGARAHGGEGPVTHRSPVLAAPSRFDAAGLAGELRPLELRARDAGGRWSRWIEVANGDPAWFGDADELQLRTRGWRPAGRIHYVSIPDPAPATRIASRAGGGQPGVVSRSSWGANKRKGGCKPRRRPEYGKVKAAVVHHTVGANRYSRAEAPGIVLAICRYHRNALDWNDIGYNALVDRFGRIYAGRAGGLEQPVVGAHAEGVNSQTTGVAMMGTHTKKGVSNEARRGLVRWLAWKLPVHGLTTEGRGRIVSSGGSTSRYDEGDRFRMKRIVGHRRTNLTECPGDGLNGQLEDVRARVQRRIDASGTPKDPGGGIG